MYSKSLDDVLHHHSSGYCPIIILQRVVGFYFGEPDEADIEEDRRRSNIPGLYDDYILGTEFQTARVVLKRRRSKYSALETIILLISSPFLSVDE